jgi:hypothetical protein
MGVLKCFGCGCYLHDDEAVWIELDENHSASYCVSCAPEQEDYDSPNYED